MTVGEFRYPEASRLDLTEDIGGHQVSDPYRWLEDDAGAERARWLSAQADLFASYRAELPGRDRLADRVRELLSTGYAGTPAWRGERCFYTRRDPGAEHGVLYTRLGDGAEQVLIDPMAIDPSGLTTLDAWQPDKEGRLLAYQLSEGGNEESLLRVIDVTTGSLVDGPIDRCRYSNVAWLPGGTGRGEPVPPAGLPAPGRCPGGRGRPHLRRRPGQDRLLRRFGQPGRAVAGHLGVAGDRAAQRPVDRRPVRIRPCLSRPPGDPGGDRRADRSAGRP